MIQQMAGASENLFVLTLEVGTHLSLGPHSESIRPVDKASRFAVLPDSEQTVLDHNYLKVRSVTPPDEGTILYLPLNIDPIENALQRVERQLEDLSKPSQDIRVVLELTEHARSEAYLLGRRAKTGAEIEAVQRINDRIAFLSFFDTQTP